MSGKLTALRPYYVLVLCLKHDFSHEANDSAPPELDKKSNVFHFLLGIPKADERIGSHHGKVKA